MMLSCDRNMRHLGRLQGLEMEIDKSIRLNIRKSLEPTKAVIFFTLIDYANDEGLCKIKVSQLEESVRCSLITIRRTLKSLEELQAIEVKYNYFRTGDKAGNLYKLRVDGEFWERKALEVISGGKP